MRTRITAIFAVLILLMLTGCNNTPPTDDEAQPYSFSESNQSSPESEAPAVEETEVETVTEQPQETKSAEQNPPAEETADESEPKQTVSTAEQAAQNADLPEKADKSVSDSASPANPSVSEPPESKEPEPEAPSAPEPEPPEEQTAETEPAFDIEYWISFAKDYAKSVGLALNSEAVYCWDNPLGAGSHSKYLERDITACLNRYAKDEDITEVWVWTEQTGDNTYDLYIGYA